jgi:iron complex outermembrane receptor protein
MRRSFVAGAIAAWIAPAAFAHAQSPVLSSSMPSPRAVATSRVDEIVCAARASSADRGSSFAAPLDRIVTVRLGDTPLREALDKVASLAHVELSYSRELLPTDRRICVSLDRVTVGAVFETLLVGTTLRPIVIGNAQVVLAPSRSAGGLDVAGTTRRASVLDRVVVTGTPDGASQRGSPFALDVIDGATLAKQRAASLGEALDRAVPGMWSWASSAGTVAARYGSIRGASSFGVSAPKIYLDGIEVANPLLVTQLDPSRIDRIEVIRGPQGAALYGADAISGVVNILTRHDGAPNGATVMQLATNAGVSSTNYASRDAFVQDHAFSLRAGSGKQTMGLGLTIGTVGAYVPGASERRVLADADVRVVRSHSVLTGTARFSMQEANASTNLLLGGGSSVFTRTPATGFLSGTSHTSGAATSTSGDRGWGFVSSADSGKMPTPAPKDTVRFAGDSANGQRMSQYTFGGTATIMPTLRWTHTFIAGVDGYRLQGLSGAGLPTPSILGTDLTNAQGAADRGTLRLRTVGRFDLAEKTSLSLTFAAEQAVLRQVDDQSGLSVVTAQGSAQGRTTNGAPTTALAPTAATSALRTVWAQNGGLSAQANVAVNDEWFFVAGGRVERSSGLTPETQVAVLPMLGASYVQDIGGAVLKWRAAYGTGIRPANSLTRGTSWMGRSVVQSASALQPESQSGIEGGLDWLFGRAFVLHVTRFDQRASGLIQPVASTATTLTSAGKWVRSVSYTLENVGAITNRGWELQGSTQLDRLSLAGTMTFVDSRVAQVATGYRGELRVGDRMLDVPLRTASLSATWTASRWTLASSLTRAEDWIGYDRLAIGQALVSTDRDHDVGGVMLRNYWMKYGGVTRLNGNFNYRLVRDISLQLTGDNLLNVQRGAPDNATITAGRTLSFGLRTTF